MTITQENSRNIFLKAPPPYTLPIVFNVNVDLIGKADMGEGGWQEGHINLFFVRS